MRKLRFGLISGLKAWTALLLLIGFAGCAALAPAPFVPEGIAESQGTRRLLEPAGRAAAAPSVFNTVKPVYWTGWLRIENGGTIAGRREMGISYFAADRDHLRLRTYLTPDDPLFDLIVQDRYMTLLQHRKGIMYQGDPDVEGSAFLKRWGFEPWDWMQIFQWDVLLAVKQFEDEPAPEGLILHNRSAPSDPNLSSITLDPETGLPREGIWQRGEQTWTVRVEAWGAFNEPGQSVHLLPKRLHIAGKRPAVRLALEIDRYFLDAKTPEGIYSPMIGYPMTRFPLERFEADLEGS